MEKTINEIRMLYNNLMSIRGLGNVKMGYCTEQNIKKLENELSRHDADLRKSPEMDALLERTKKAKEEADAYAETFEKSKLEELKAAGDVPALPKGATLEEKAKALAGAEKQKKIAELMKDSEEEKAFNELRIAAEGVLIPIEFYKIKMDDLREFEIGECPRVKDGEGKELPVADAFNMLKGRYFWLHSEMETLIEE
jgi:hypothetical protein